MALAGVGVSDVDYMMAADIICKERLALPNGRGIKSPPSSRRPGIAADLIGRSRPLDCAPEDVHEKRHGTKTQRELHGEYFTSGNASRVGRVHDIAFNDNFFQYPTSRPFGSPGGDTPRTSHLISHMLDTHITDSTLRQKLKLRPRGVLEPPKLTSELTGDLENLSALASRLCDRMHGGERRLAACFRARDQVPELPRHDIAS